MGTGVEQGTPCVVSRDQSLQLVLRDKAIANVETDLRLRHSAAHEAARYFAAPDAASRMRGNDVRSMRGAAAV